MTPRRGPAICPGRVRFPPSEPWRMTRVLVEPARVLPRAVRPAVRRGRLQPRPERPPDAGAVLPADRPGGVHLTGDPRSLSVLDALRRAGIRADAGRLHRPDAGEALPRRGPLHRRPQAGDTAGQ